MTYQEWAVAKFREWADEDLEHQPREHAVPCQVCRDMTWNRSAICKICELLGRS